MKRAKGLLKIAVAITLVFSFSTASAQLVMTPTDDLSVWLNKFVGSNVQVLNPTITCYGTADSLNSEFGLFDNGSTTTLGLEGGVILGTCKVTDIDQPVGVFVPAGNGSYTPGHPVLTAICGFPTHDACVVEFDFTAELDTVSTLSFDYVFGSEEYPEYACSSFNDPFAFIISGPGIVGNQNIAVVPGTNVPVTINSVNMAPQGTFYSLTNCNNMGPGAPFSQYYVDNEGQNGQFIVFDGFTTVLTAEATPIQPCDTYHMFLGVSNASDGGWQTAVFLKEHSFSVDSTTVDLAGLIESQGGYLIEGCTPLDIIFSHDTSAHRAKKLCFHYSGTAVNGVDVNLLPDTLMIPANVVSGSLSVVPLLDGIQETFNYWNPVTGWLDSVKTDVLNVYLLNCCTRDTLNPKDSIKIPIRDSLYMNLLSRDTFYCEGAVDTTVVHVTGDSVYNYLWTPSGTVGNPIDTLTWVLPVQTTTYTVTASYPGCPEISRQVTVSIEPNPLVNIVMNDTALCVTEPVPLLATVDPPNSPYNYSWAPVDGNIDNPGALSPNFYYNGSGVFSYTLSVTTPHGCLGTDSITIEAFPGIIGDIRISDTSVCTNDFLQLDVIVTPQSMEATSSYQWSPGTYLSDPQAMEPTYHTTIDQGATYVYTMISTNTYGCHDTDQITIHAIKIPDIYLMPDTALCLHEPLQIKMDVGPDGGTYSSEWTPSTHLDNANAQEPYFWTTFNTDHADYTYYVKVTESTWGCFSRDTLHIHTYPHVFLESIDDQIVKYGDRVQLWADNALYYVWTPTTHLDNPNIKAPTANGLEPVEYTVIGINEWGCRDTNQVNVNIDYTMDEFVPSVFSPNGDGKNDIFRLVNMKHQKVTEFRVFNRWGKEIYNNPDNTKGWDGTYKGTPQDPGTYSYLIRVAIPDGKQKIYQGNVTLVR